jgi:hypothetical protein
MKVFFLHRKGIVFFVLKYSYVFSPKDDRSTNEPFEVDEHGPQTIVCNPEHSCNIPH